MSNWARIARELHGDAGSLSTHESAGLDGDKAMTDEAAAREAVRSTTNIYGCDDPARRKHAAHQWRVFESALDTYRTAIEERVRRDTLASMPVHAAHDERCYDCNTVVLAVQRARKEKADAHPNP